MRRRPSPAHARLCTPQLTMEAHMATPSEYGFTKACYSVNETLTILSVGRTLLYDLVKRGELTPAKLGTKTLFYASDLADLLTRLRERKAAAARRGSIGVP